MTELYMRGPERVQTLLASHLSIALPELLVQCRAEWGLSIWDLPDPTRYDCFEPYDTNDYPVIGSYIPSDQSMSRKDYDGNMAEEYEVMYSFRVFASVRTPQNEDETFMEPEYEQTIRLRNRMTTALRMCLLRTPSLGRPEECEVQEDTLNTDYPDALRLKSQSNRYVAAGVINGQLKLVERLSREPIGFANYLTVHPELMES